MCNDGKAELGFLENCLLLFRGSNSNESSDYRTEMKWSVFSDWCESRVFPLKKQTKQNFVLVLDRATYRTFLDKEDVRPAMYRNKVRLIDSSAQWEGIAEYWPLKWRVKTTKNELLERGEKSTRCLHTKFKKLLRFQLL